jgi:hypothetical protein
MIPSNFRPSRPLKPQEFVHYTDGTPSRELSEELDEDIPFIIQFRNKLERITNIIKELEEEISDL